MHLDVINQTSSSRVFFNPLDYLEVLFLTPRGKSRSRQRFIVLLPSVLKKKKSTGRGRNDLYTSRARSTWRYTRVSISIGSQVGEMICTEQLRRLCVPQNSDGFLNIYDDTRCRMKDILSQEYNLLGS